MKTRNNELDKILNSLGDGLSPAINVMLNDTIGHLGRLSGSTGYPPMNSGFKLNDKANKNEFKKSDIEYYFVEVALAGFKKDELSLDYDPEKKAFILSATHEEKEEDLSYITQGIAKRNVKMKIGVPFEVGSDFEATFEGGMLLIKAYPNKEFEEKKIDIK